MEKQLTEEQKTKIKSLARHYFLASFFTGVHTALLLWMFAFIVHLAAGIFFDSPETPELIGYIISFLFVMQRMNSTMKARRDFFNEEAAKIVQEENTTT